MPRKESKPPLGLMPRNIWEQCQREERLRDVREAIVRYLDAELAINPAWLHEYNELCGVGGFFIRADEISEQDKETLSDLQQQRQSVRYPPPDDTPRCRNCLHWTGTACAINRGNGSPLHKCCKWE